MGRLPVIRTVRNSLAGPLRPGVLFLFVETAVWMAIVVAAMFVALSIAGLGGPGTAIIEAVQEQLPASEADMGEAPEVPQQLPDEAGESDPEAEIPPEAQFLADLLDSLEGDAEAMDDPNASTKLGAVLAVTGLLIFYLSLALPVSIHRVIALNLRPFSLIFVFKQLRWVIHYFLAAILHFLVTVLTIVALGGGLFYLGSQIIQTDFSALTQGDAQVETQGDTQAEAQTESQDEGQTDMPAETEVDPQEVFEFFNTIPQQDQYIILGLLAVFLIGSLYISLRILPGLPAAAVRGIGSWWKVVRATHGNVLRIAATALLLGVVIAAALAGLMRLFPAVGSEVLLLMITGIDMAAELDPRAIGAYAAIQYYLGALGVVYLTEIYRGVAPPERRSRAAGRRRRRR